METNPDLQKFNTLSDEQLAAFLDGNVSADEACAVLSAIASYSEVAEIMDIAAAIDDEADSLRILPMSALAAANAENLCSFECELMILQQLGYDTDHWTLLETAKANNWLRDCGTPLHHVGRLMELKGISVERKYDATLDDVKAALTQSRRVIAIVDKRCLSANSGGSKRPAYHAVILISVDGRVGYYDPSTKTENIVDMETFLNAWKCSGNYMVLASKEFAPYNPQPINVEDIELDADLVDLTEAIAENAHDIWARARMDEGWTYGPVRNDALKQHPDLVPYSQLPDSEKEYDRIMAMNTLRLVRRLGFTLLPQSLPNYPK